MATKNNPGKFDCYGNAEPDEPLFVLLARDILGEHLVALWVAIRAHDPIAARGILEDAFHALEKSAKPELTYESEKSVEAQQCAKNMRAWRLNKKAEQLRQRLDANSNPSNQ